MTPFHLFSTAGNTSLLLEGQGDIGRAMELIHCEQAGYVDLPGATLTMAGGELCVNACLAYAALLECRGIGERTIGTADSCVEVRATPKGREWEASGLFPFRGCAVERCGEEARVQLPGIGHRLIRAGDFPADGLVAARSYLEVSGDGAANGVIWWRPSADAYEIYPVVSVPGAHTYNREAACGSGSVAMALYLGPGCHRVRQPSGGIITVSYADDKLLVSAPVRLLARGQLCLY